ncbi:hypothetical protein PQX77_001225 [Marasmius sp. AFHP31]|nr:hypothetical protein PQX77_001225 [Marasmius sp. AFHP31]
MEEWENERQIWDWINFDKKERSDCTRREFPLWSTYDVHDADLFLLLRRLIEPPPDPLENGRLEQELTCGKEWMSKRIMNKEEKEAADKVWKKTKNDPNLVDSLDSDHPYHRLVYQRERLERQREMLAKFDFRHSGAPAIHSLPVELQEAILEHIPEYYFVLSYALTSTHSWNIAKNRLITILRTSAWAGNRIICYGSFSEELPSFVDPAILTKPPQESDEEEVTDQSTGTSLGRIPFPKAHISNNTTLFGSPTEFSERGDLYNHDHGRHWALVDDVVAQCKEFVAWLKPFGDAGPHGDYVLRNLDKLEYTSAPDVCLDDKGRLDYRQVQRRWFGFRLALLTRWTDNIGRDRDTIRDMLTSRGAWAGDRLDLVHSSQKELVVDRHGLVTKENGWKNITGKVGDDLTEIFETLGWNTWGEFPWSDSDRRQFGHEFVLENEKLAEAYDFL